MILVDTSIWIDHLRVGDPMLVALLHASHVLVHPCVIGEIALGQLTNRHEILGLLRNLPHSQTATDDEVLNLIEDRHLFRCGIGYLDAHLLAATLLTTGARLWTRDKRLAAVADQLRIVYHYEPGMS